jgi:hypothetical protein
MSWCISPFCKGIVTLETSTEGHCAECGLHHRRRAGAAGWGQLVGPLTVTLWGATHEVFEADAVRFRAGYFTIDVAGGSIRVEPVARLVNLAASPSSDRPTTRGAGRDVPALRKHDRTASPMPPSARSALSVATTAPGEPAVTREAAPGNVERDRF